MEELTVDEINKTVDFFVWLGNLDTLREFELIWGQSAEHYLEKMRECNFNGAVFWNRLDINNKVKVSNEWNQSVNMTNE